MLTTWILYHILCLLSTINFIFLKFFLIVCFSKTIICDSSVIIPLGVMLVNHKIQIFWIILFVGVNVLISIGMEGPLATHVIFLMWTVRGKAISEFRSPNVVPRMLLTSHYSDRIVIPIPSHPHTTSHNAGQGANRVRIRPSPN